MPWKVTLWQVLPKIIHYIFDWLDKRGRQYDYDERQEKRDKAASDPKGAFKDHFQRDKNKEDS